jgi:hypothetical protein
VLPFERYKRRAASNKGLTMRKVTEEATQAFFADQKFNSQNTKVETGHTIWPKTCLVLHGNTIACKEENGISFTSAGYQTNVTKERLNGILRHYSAYIKQENFEWFIYHRHGKTPMLGTGWYAIDENHVLTEPRL